LQRTGERTNREKEDQAKKVRTSSGGKDLDKLAGLSLKTHSAGALAIEEWKGFRTYE